MIQRVSMTNNKVSFSQNTKQNSSNTVKTSKITPYVDSFVKNSVDSTPMLLAVTGAWTAYDILSQKAPWKKAIKHNVMGFFVPVMLVSSSILSIVENKKTSKSSN